MGGGLLEAVVLRAGGLARDSLLGLIHYGACSSFLGLRKEAQLGASPGVRPFQGPMGSVGTCGYDFGDFQDFGAWVFKFRPQCRKVPSEGVSSRVCATTELSETWGHLS